MTQIIVLGRAQGKTTKALQYLKDNPGFILVTATESMAASLLNQARRLEIENFQDRVVSARSIARSPERARDAHYIVDNAELVLAGLLNGSIEVMTATGTLDG